MSFPWAVVALLAALPTGAFDGADVADGSVLVAAGEDDPGAGGEAAEATGAPPRLLTYETRASISAALTFSETMPAAFIWAVGAVKTVVNCADGY